MLVVALAGCVADLEPHTLMKTVTVTESTVTYDEWYEPAAGGLGIRSGLDLVEIASVTGPGEWCGEEPPLALGDTNADAVPELIVTCRAPDQSGGDLYDVYVLDGASALGNTFVAAATIPLAHTHGVTAVGDLDGDGLQEIGLGPRWSMLSSDDEVDWWFVRPGASLVGATSATDGSYVVSGDGDLYGNGAPVGAGDVDLDGVPDLAGWQHPGSGASVLHLVSGADLLADGTLSVVTDALRTIDGLEDDEGIDDLTTIGDVDADGQVDLAAVVTDTSGQYGRDNHVAVTVIRGNSVTDPATTMRVHGSLDGRDRAGVVENLGDLDGDGLPELAALLGMFSSSEEKLVEVAVIPSSVLSAGVDVPIAPYVLGPAGDTGGIWSELVACDLDGDGLFEIVTDGGVWDGRDLLVPGAPPIGPGVPFATCAGDLDGVPGSELLVGKPEGQ
jgi:hypothetical protein